MREIKFRGMDVNGHWFYGHLSVLKEDINFVKSGTYISNSIGQPFAYQVRPETVGQYIGLNDKNGTKIYEGDTIRFPDSYSSGGEDGDWEESVSIGFIKWDDEQAMFYVTNRNSIDMESLWEAIDEVEVIGNIHE